MVSNQNYADIAELKKCWIKTVSNSIKLCENLFKSFQMGLKSGSKSIDQDQNCIKTMFKMC